LARLKKYWLKVIAAVLVVFEVIAVLVLRAHYLRAHYTMDVVTGIFAALWVSKLGSQSE
jgi:hypothetical protein